MKLKPEDHGWTKQAPGWYTKLFKPNIFCGIVKDKSGWRAPGIEWILKVYDKEYHFRTLSGAGKFTNTDYMFVRWDNNE